MRYAELCPDQLQAAFEAAPVAIWPIGALEWHGPHLPLGLDGLVAEAFAEALQAEVGGVLLPTYWHPITTLPHPMSLDVATDVQRGLLRRTLIRLGVAGAKVVCLVTGHYAQGHSVELFEIARAFTRNAQEPTVIAASPLEPLGDDALLDHAARWETAQLLALRPDLVDLSRLPDDLRPKSCAVLGEDPRLASAEEARQKTREALTVWQGWVSQVLGGKTEAVLAFYERRLQSYQSYIARNFRTSWDQAIEDWWRTQP